jgi:deoxyribodipyrimidine photo-lyase
MPWTMPADIQQAAGCVIGRDYPAPLVDHAAAVREAKRGLAAVRNAPAARAEARAVAEQHGSRRDRRGAMQQDPVRRSLAGEATKGRRRAASPPNDPQQWLPFASPESVGEPSPLGDDGSS